MSTSYRDIVICVWEDAHGDAHREVTEDDLPHRPMIMKTIGWLLKQDDKGVSIANEHCSDGDAMCYRGCTFVPAGMIISITPFKLQTPRKTRPANEKVPSVPPGTPDI